jgi:hypothetical protein
VGEVNGNGAFGAGFEAASADAGRVFFETAERLVSADTDAAQDIYERSAETTTLISAGQVNGNGAFGASPDRLGAHSRKDIPHVNIDYADRRPSGQPGRALSERAGHAP